MKHSALSRLFAIIAFVIATTGQSHAGEVSIEAANFRNTGAEQWSVNTTLKHADTGWDHYADNWRIVDENGKVLGERVLQHPHVDEQPFTRSLSVNIPTSITTVFIEAHDKKHGWTSRRLKVDLNMAKDGRLTVRP